VAVADRYPQNVFAEHTHEFCELVLVWRGNGLHILNDRPYRITRGDLFYIRAEDKHSYASVNDLVLQNIIYCPDRLTLNLDWAGHIPGLSGEEWTPHWRLGSTGMARQDRSSPNWSTATMADALETDDLACFAVDPDATIVLRSTMAATSEALSLERFAITGS
jgi:hypothetical protein